MPNLKDMLAKAREEEIKKKNPAIVKGIRPDRILRGEVELNRGTLFEENGIEEEIETTEAIQSVEVDLKNPEQTQNKVRTKSYHNPEQSQNKPRTKSEQKNPHFSESQNKVLSQPRTKSEQKSEQTQNKPRTTEGFTSLVGLQRLIILFIYDLCRARGQKNTGAVSLEQLSNACKTTSGAAQVTVRRLIKKGQLLRVSYKDGRGGWTIYELPDTIYAEVFQLETQNKVRTNPEQTQNKVLSQPRTQPRTNAPSSSSKDIDLNKLTTTTGTSEFERKTFPEWEHINANALTNIRFGRPQIIQIAQWKRLTPAELQDSIDAFAFDLSENQKAKNISGSPLNYFMGILRKGPYAAPPNYESSEDHQRRLYLEAKEEQRKRRQEREARLERIEFEEWVDKLSLEQRTELVPAQDFAKPGSQAHNALLKQYFQENVWPQFREGTLKKSEK